VRRLHAYRVGRIGYGRAHTLQQRLVTARQTGAIEDTLLLLEHPPVFTLGRGARDGSNLLVDRTTLAAQGFEVHETGRGGDVTYHGPGQLVAYPILDLSPDRQDVRRYVASLEETMIRLAADHGVCAERLEGFNGAWVEPRSARARKIGAVGVRISRWVTMHGFAFNVSPNLAHFELIVPCGIRDKGVTSLERELSELGRPAPALDEVLGRAGEHFAALHGSELHWHEGLPDL